MIYKTFQNLKLSALAMGCMRLPVIGGEDAHIDEEQTFRMVDYAMAHGVNYYDTAWGYHGGNSETVMGRALARYPRESFYLADKFPGYDRRNFGKAEEILETQLEKCGVDYFDFYLFHNVCMLNIEQYLDPQYGTYDYLIAQKRSGRIRHLGFSCHGDLEVLRRFLEAYGEDMEFCQLQLNYLDWTFQNDREKMALLAEYGIPVWVMEPVRGGRLAKLSEAHEARLKALRPEEPAVAWAYRFLQSLPQVTVVLSGASDFAQMQQNIALFSEEKPLSNGEMAALLEIAGEMLTVNTVPCTACHYCVSHCPMGLDIPMLLGLYNEHSFTGGGFLAPMAIGAVTKDKRPSACIGCRSCEAVCPQQIKICEAFADFNEKLKH